MTNSVLETFKNYKEKLKREAEQLVLTGFPEKIVHLNDLLESPLFNENLKNAHQPDGTIDCCNDDEPINKSPKRNFNDVDDNGTVPCNQVVLKMIKLVKPYVMQMMKDAKILEMWVSLMIPKIEDGNNFGVSVQKSILAHIKSVYLEVRATFHGITQYFEDRANIVVELAKSPQIEDYRLQVLLLDEKQYKNVCLFVCGLRNCYSILHNIITSNLEKIKKPRSTSSESHYFHL